LQAFNLKGEQKEKDNVIRMITNLYTNTYANIVNFEAVNAYSYLVDDLKAKGVAVNAITPHKDKVTRLMEKEADIKNGKIRFID
jgi:phage terminase large subunit-like protein